MLPGHLADCALSPGGGELSAVSGHDAVIKHLDFLCEIYNNIKTKAPTIRQSLTFPAL